MRRTANEYRARDKQTYVLSEGNPRQYARRITHFIRGIREVAHYILICPHSINLFRSMLVQLSRALFVLCTQCVKSHINISSLYAGTDSKFGLWEMPSAVLTVRVVQPLSDQNWVNRAFCGKSMTLGTDVHHTKPRKFSYSAKPDFPRGVFGGHLKKWPLCHHISETKRRRAIIVDSNNYIGFLCVDFRKGIAEYIMILYPPFWRPFQQNGGHFQK